MPVDVYSFIEKHEALVILFSCLLLLVVFLMIYFVSRHIRSKQKCHKLKNWSDCRQTIEPTSLIIPLKTSQNKLFKCAESLNYVASNDVSKKELTNEMQSEPTRSDDSSLRIQLDLNDHYTQSLSFDSSQESKLYKQSIKKPLCRQSNLGSKRLLERRGSNISLSIKLTSAASFDSHFKRSNCKSTLDIEYFDLSTATNVLSICQLHNKSVNCKDLEHEFNKIQTNAIYDLDIDGYYEKNRYSEVLPNKHSRVILPLPDPTSPSHATPATPATPAATSASPHIPGPASPHRAPSMGASPTSTQEPESVECSTYINANYIRDMTGRDKVYIATQGPISSTVNDMWRMIWGDKCPVVVMITKLVENNQCKCADYLPCCTDECGQFGEYNIKVDKVVERSSYIIRIITMTDHRNNKHTLKHYWYTSWPDHGVPKTYNDILECVREVEDDRKVSNGPIIVHCSAGIGRSGCFMAICMGIQQLLATHSVDILSIVCSMRSDRGNLVQNISQYKFIHEALDIYAQILNKQQSDRK